MSKDPYTSESFVKAERLTSSSEINRLFTHGKSFLVFPFRVTWLISSNEQAYPVKVVTGVKKKSHKRAVKRNLIKRRSREAYRRHKTVLYKRLDQQGVSIHMALIYISPDILDYKIIEKAMPRIISTLKKHLSDDYTRE